VTIDQLETPALLIDVDIMERNLQRMAAYAAANGLRLRPHTKTHKIPALGRRQIDLGAVGLTVAKVGEAEVMLSSGTPDLLVAYPTIGLGKLTRLMEVARRTRVTVALDSFEAARQLDEMAGEAEIEVGVLTEIDVGLNRVGVTPGPELVDLVRRIVHLKNVDWEGIAYYPGHIKKMDADGEAKMVALSDTVARAINDLGDAGYTARIVSGGSTPTWMRSHEVAGLTEIRPGTYIFNDRNTVNSCACDWEDCAGTILCTVVSTARPGQMIIDGGSKTFSSDRLTGSTEVTFGRLTTDPAARFHAMNEEHGFVDISQSEHRYQVGQRVRLIPNHICVAMNLHERVHAVRGSEVVATWTVEGRGKLQ
jgi:D-serine deaminase-like pyridoxal phosphate-dependent protein